MTEESLCEFTRLAVKQTNRLEIWLWHSNYAKALFACKGGIFLTYVKLNYIIILSRKDKITLFDFLFMGIKNLRKKVRMRGKREWKSKTLHEKRFTMRQTEWE